ncbi:hypothetical protein CHS0354_025633 [Potamilus streckersoni]|uniref:Uncharacterized protein n=1 Tax=Potamilus streckersoni TaxID=2493646 RepID=A0AAE0VNS8_9BIVA|nr:hypothetical protein CHS0354_025633 [Potamilus streckersoni]
MFTVSIALGTLTLWLVSSSQRVDRLVSNSNTFAVSNIDDRNKNLKEEDDRNKNLKEEVPSGNYWTIVCNTEGELSNVIETDFEKRIQKQLILQNIVSTQTESNKPVRPRDVQQVIVEVEGYLNPIQAYPVELNDYIHPINTDMVNSGVIPTGQSTVTPSESHVDLELDRYLNPIEEFSVELDDYIHPIHLDPVTSDFVSTHQSTEF